MAAMWCSVSSVGIQRSRDPVGGGEAQLQTFGFVFSNLRLCWKEVPVLREGRVLPPMDTGEFHTTRSYNTTTTWSLLDPPASGSKEKWTYDGERVLSTLILMKRQGC